MRARLRAAFAALSSIAFGCSTVATGVGDPAPQHTPAEPNVSVAPQREAPPDASSHEPDTDAATTSDAGTTSPDDASPSEAATGDATVDAGPPIVPDAKRVFLTSHAFTGDLQTEGWASSGLEGGDALCNAAALAAGLGGTWRAWLSAPGVDARDRIVDVSPWYLVDRRTLVFDKMVGLGRGAALPAAPGVDVGPFVSIDMNEHGALTLYDVWTGTTRTGVASANNCSGWTSTSAGQGLMGFDIQWWTDGTTTACSHRAALMCFEQ